MFTTKNGDRILGAKMKVSKGTIILTPYLKFETEDNIKYDKNDKASWTAKAIQVGSQFFSNLVEIDNVLNKIDTKTPKPDWVKNERYVLIEAEQTKQLITENIKKCEKIQEENLKLNSVLEEQESIKDLLFETGKALEQAVTKSLKILGFKAENFDDGDLELDQIIVSPEGHRLIGECEGKDSKDIDVSKFRQLLDGLNADFERDEVNEKASGVLFGNPQRLLDPTQRTLDFTKNAGRALRGRALDLLKQQTCLTHVNIL